MILKGTIVNVIAILIGSLMGRYLGHFFPERIRRTIIAGLGLAVLLIGTQLALQSNNVLIVIGSLLIGGIIGEVLGIEAALENVGGKTDVVVGQLAGEFDAIVTVAAE